MKSVPGGVRGVGGTWNQHLWAERPSRAASSILWHVERPRQERSAQQAQSNCLATRSHLPLAIAHYATATGRTTRHLPLLLPLPLPLHPHHPRKAAQPGRLAAALPHWQPARRRAGRAGGGGRRGAGPFGRGGPRRRAVAALPCSIGGGRMGTVGAGRGTLKDGYCRQGRYCEWKGGITRAAPHKGKGWEVATTPPTTVTGGRHGRHASHPYQHAMECQ